MLAFVKSLQKDTNSFLIDMEKMLLLSALMDRLCKVDGVKEVMKDLTNMLEFIFTLRVIFTSPPTSNYGKPFHEDRRLYLD
jgi:hypothetical protein